MQKRITPLSRPGLRASRLRPTARHRDAPLCAGQPAPARLAAKRPAQTPPPWPAPFSRAGGRFLGLVCLLLASPLYGGIIADGGAPPHQQPEVIITANALPLVNICAPDSAGTSYNQYHYFDVDGRGVILNNARTVSQTALAGQVDANPLLTREATLIINEVTQPHSSLLDGTIEVAGQRANVIIANPAGISCSGCGFINVGTDTLTTGYPISEDGQLKGFNVYGGQIDIAGRGMDAAKMDATKLIARAVEVNAEVQSQSLGIVTGRNRVNVAGDVTETFADVQADKANYALDVAALGGMYAKKIVMVGTEKGVGVRNAGELGASVGELSLSAAGRLENRGSMQSQDTLTLAGAGDVINTGCLITSNHARLSAAGTFFNTGTVRAGGDITLSAQRVDMMGDSLLAAGSDAQGQLTRPGNLMLTSQGPLIALGDNQATGALMVWGSEVDLTGSRTSGTDITLSANQGALCTDGAQVCGGKITARAATSFTNNNGRLSANRLTLEAQDISNRLGTLEQRGGEPLQLKVHQMNNHQGLLATNGDTLIRTAWFDNRAGRITVNGPNLSLKTKILDNQGGTIKLLGSGRMVVTAERLNDYQGILWSTGAMALTGEELDLTQSVTRAQSLSLTATHLQHQRSIMWQLGAGQMKLQVSGEADNRGGWIQSGGALWLKSGYLNNPGGTLMSSAHGSLFLHADRGTNNVYGHLQGSRDVTLKSNKLDNQGGRLLALGGDAQLETQLVIVNTGGRIEAKNRLSTRSQHLMNAYGVMASDEVTVDTRRKSLSNTGGSVTAKRGLRITSGPLDNNGGRLQSGGNLIIDTRNSALCNRFTVNAGINCGGDLFLNTGDIDNTSGMITAAGRTEVDGGVVKNIEGRLATARGMKLLSRSLDNEGGNVHAGALLVVNTGALDNTAGSIRAAGVARLTSREFDNCGGCLQTGNDLHIDTQGQRLTNAYNSFAGILAGGNLTLHAGGIDNTAGLINASGECRVSSDALLNARGRVQSGEYLQLDTHGQRLDNAHSRNAGILSGGGLLIHAGDIINTAGRIIARAEGRIASGMIDNAGGQLQANSDLHIDTQGQRLSNIHSVNTGILSGGDLWLHAGEIDNTSGIIVAVGQTRVSRTGLNNLDGRLFTDPALVLLTPTLTLPGVRLDAGAPPAVPSQSAHPLNPGQSAAGVLGDAMTRNAFTPAGQHVMPRR